MPALLAAIQQSNAQMLHHMSSFQHTVAALQNEIANIRTEKKSDLETIAAAAIDAAKQAVAMKTPKKDKDKPVSVEIQKANRAKMEPALQDVGLQDQHLPDDAPTVGKRGPRYFEPIAMAEAPWAAGAVE
eukprot:2535714-Pyramimonas_sp.AAC.1